MKRKAKVVLPPVVATPSVMPEPPTVADTPGAKSFFERYWQFILWGVIFFALVLNNTVFKYVGAMTYLPLKAFSVFILAFVFRHILNKTSTDAYIHGDAFDKDFASLPAIHKTWIKTVEFAVYILVIAILAASSMGAEPTLEQRFNSTEIRPEWTARLDRVVAGIVRDKERYEAIQKMRANGMPWYIVAGLHERESSRDFSKHLHEGSPLIYRTRDVPKGRLPLPANPPFTWPQSAEDALYVLKKEQNVAWNDKNAALDAIEKYNGLGYRNWHPTVKSPYLWSATRAYERGKYVADGRFSPIAVDQQVGVAAVWKRMIERGLL